MENFELTDEELNDYIDVALSNADRVGPEAKHKLHGLLKYYAEKKHPFTACVRDNTKRFGKDRAEKVCAVLKDIIRGSTDWRGKNNPKDKGTSKAAMAEEFALDLDETTQIYLDEELQQMEIPEDKIELATGDVVWSVDDSLEHQRTKLNEALNPPPDPTGMEVSYSEYWVQDIAPKRAVVCYKGTDYFVVPFSMKNGEVVVSEEEKWTPVESAWVEANLSEEPQLLAEMFFNSGDEVRLGDDGLIYKTVLREGEWKYSPGPGQVPVDKPIKVVKSGASNGRSKVISMEEIKTNFEAGIVEHVTVPKSHDDKVDENTGYVKSLRIGQDNSGRAILEAGFDFTEPDIKEKVKRGSIANTSAGILFDYIRKEDGRKVNAVMAHAALTNHPWLNGMKPFGVEASENLQVVAFSEENTSPIGGESMTTENTAVVETPKEDTLLTKLGLSEDEVTARLSEYNTLKENEKKSAVETQIKTWQDKGVAPAVLTEAKNVLLSDEGSVAIHLSENGSDKPFTATQLVERIVNAIPVTNLSDDKTKGEQNLTDGNRPADDTTEENKYADLSLSERAEASSLILYQRMDEEDAVAQIRASRATK